MSGRGLPLLGLLLGLLGPVALVTGCSILSKSELPPPRYFRPGPVVPASGDVAPADAATRLLRLREVTAAAHLHERMVWAQPDGEYGFYEDARWTEPPPAYVEAALARALFEEGRFRRADGADAPMLDVHAVAFEEVIGGPEPGVRVGLRVMLTTREGQSLLERTLLATRPVGAGADAAAIARALGEALGQVVDEAADAIGRAYPPA